MGDLCQIMAHEAMGLSRQFDEPMGLSRQNDEKSREILRNPEKSRKSGNPLMARPLVFRYFLKSRKMYPSSAYRPKSNHYPVMGRNYNRFTTQINQTIKFMLPESGAFWHRRYLSLSLSPSPLRAWPARSGSQGPSGAEYRKFGRRQCQHGARPERHSLNSISASSTRHLSSEEKGGGHFREPASARFPSWVLSERCWILHRCDIFWGFQRARIGFFYERE